MDFQTIYEEFYPKILRYLKSMIGDADADDLTQEVMLKINLALPDFRGESKLSTWIYRIATNATLDHIRSSTYKQSMLPVNTTGSYENSDIDIEDQNIWTGEKIPAPESQLTRKEMSDCVQEYIHRLPEGYRVVLVLGEFEKLSLDEIATILETTKGAVKIKLHRARERLKKDLIANCPSYWVDGNEFLPDLSDL